MRYKEKQLQNSQISWNRKNYQTIALREQTAMCGVCNLFPVYLAEPNSNVADTLFNLMVCQLESEWNLLEKTVGMKEYTMLQALINSRKLYCDNIVTTVSKVTKYSSNKGLFELEADGIISATEITRTTPITPLYMCERNTKGTGEYTIKIISEGNNIDKIEAKNTENLLRLNVKKMAENNTYNYLAMHNSCINPYGFPLYQADISYTIASSFRKFDSALKNLLDNSTSQATDTEKHKRTKLLYKNHFSLSDNVFKKFYVSDTEPLIALDGIIYNYEMERLYHFSLLPLLIRYRRDFLKKHTYIADLDKLLMSFSDLPNAFLRNKVLEKVFNQTDIDFSKELTALNMQAYYYYPVISKSFFHNMYNNSVANTLGFNCSIKNTITRLQELLLQKFENNSILDDLGYCSQPYIYKSNFDSIAPESLTNSELDFVYEFFKHNFSRETYNYRNSIILSYDYFGFPQPDTLLDANTEILDHINTLRKSNIEFFLKYGLPFTTA